MAVLYKSWSLGLRNSTAFVLSEQLSWDLCIRRWTEPARGRKATKVPRQWLHMWIKASWLLQANPNCPAKYSCQNKPKKKQQKSCPADPQNHIKSEIVVKSISLVAVCFRGANTWCTCWLKSSVWSGDLLLQIKHVTCHFRGKHLLALHQLWHSWRYVLIESYEWLWYWINNKESCPEELSKPTEDLLWAKMN